MQATTIRTCALWCTDHDYEADACHGADIELDFEAPDRPTWMVYGASTSLTYNGADGLYVTVNLPATGEAEMTVEDAQQLADAILQEVSYARVTQLATDLRTMS